MSASKIHNWATAYYLQAISDWEKYQFIHENDSGCHSLHYLQMTTEKLGKAVLLKSSSRDLANIKSSHHAFTSFLRIAARNPRLREKVGMNTHQLKEAIDSVLPIANAIEHLAPALAKDGPNAEYPWEDSEEEIHVPAKYQFPVLTNLRNPKGRNLIKLIGIFVEHFDVLFI